MTWPPLTHQDVQDQVDLKLAITDASGTYAKSQVGVHVPAGWGRFYKAKRNAAGSAPCVISVIGDSIAQGYYASDLDATNWIGRLRTSLQTTYGDGGSGFKGVSRCSVVDPTMSAYPSGQRVTPAVAGNWGADSGANTKARGPGGVSLFTGTSGESMTYPTIRGTIVDLWAYVNGAVTCGPYKYNIDGAADVIASQTNDGTNRITQHTVTGLSSGNHTIVAKQYQNYFYTIGATGRNTTGLRIDNYGIPSARTSWWNDTTQETGQGGGDVGAAKWSGGWKNQADLLIVSLGVNDATDAVSEATFMANMRSILDQAGPNVYGQTDVLFLLNHVGTIDNATTPVYHLFSQRMRGFAEAYGAALIDMWAIGANSWQYGSSHSYWGTVASLGAAGSDGVHPSNTGHQLIADTLLPILTAT